jgi:hypothetical protein
MGSLSGNMQDDLIGFVEAELEMADEFLEDAVVYIQLRHFFFAMEALQNASLAMKIAERYVGDVTEPNCLLQYRSHVLAVRERVHLLEQSIATEGASTFSAPKLGSTQSALARHSSLSD